jgi:hypothetical protein
MEAQVDYHIFLFFVPLDIPVTVDHFDRQAHDI